jgi:hypothetical protein
MLWRAWAGVPKIRRSFPADAAIAVAAAVSRHILRVWWFVMPLFGLSRPIAKIRACARQAVLGMAVSALTLAPVCALAAEREVRLRFAWGGGGQAPQKWQGKIAVAGATLEALQPLGIEADEAAALRLGENEIIVAPQIRRAFDGCDVTVRGDESASVKVELQYAPGIPAKVIEAPLAQLANQHYRSPLDDFGSYLLIHRSPGDKLRVRMNRDHLVFEPNEALELFVDADLKAEASRSPVTINMRLTRAGAAETIWQISKPIEPESSAPIAVQLNVPAEEGAYRLMLVAQHPEGLAGRLSPWKRADVLAERDVSLVVVDPERRLPQLTDQWEVVSTIDPANSSWWQRLPQWTQVDKLPAFSTPRPLGNVKSGGVANSPLGLVELPAPPAPNDEPAWQAYLLPVRRVGQPHAVEIEIPRGHRQHLAVSIVEPDAAGRVLSFGRDCGVYSSQESFGDDAPGAEVHRVAFWPRTRSPALLVANQSPSRPAQYGKIRLLRRTVAEPTLRDEGAHANTPNERSRLVAAYVGAPRFAESLGAAEELDVLSGLSVDGWSTFLEGANRLAQELHASGYNAAIVSIAADGSSLAPVDSLGASPRYDTGPLSATGADPLRKDVLELLLRVFDREGLQLIPAVQLAAPLPRLESLKQDAKAGEPSGTAWIGHDGCSWSQRYPLETALAPHYNVLEPKVRKEIAVIADQLMARYGRHSALAGLALQLSGNGYGVLPGLAWGFDDETTSRFAAENKLELPSDGPDRFQRRTAMLLGPQLPTWKKWRQEQVTALYSSVLEQVTKDSSSRQLFLCLEDALSGNEAAERLRQAVAGRASVNDSLDEIGLDLSQLAAMPRVALLRPRRLGADESIDARALDLRLNAASEFDQALADRPTSGELIVHTSTRLRLPSFDAQSPFGAEQTNLAFTSPSVPAGDAALETLATSLAGRDFVTLAAGAEILPLAENDAFIAALRTFQELPPAGGDVRTERQQPMTLRIYREAQSTTLCLINESPWSVDVELPLEFDADAAWRQLGTEPNASGSGGTLPAGTQPWVLTLRPYDVEARRFSSRTMRVGKPTLQVAPKAQTELARRIDEIEQRMSNLAVERTYNKLENPQFELVDDNGRLVGWQPRVGQAGGVEVTHDQAATGRCVHLRSEDPLGVAVQSHLFAVPATGQLLLRAKVRAPSTQPGAQLYAWVEYQAGGAMIQRYVPLGGRQPLEAGWTECEFAVDDLPLASSAQMRIQFHLTGSGEAWVDDVRLYDLRFSNAQCVELGKRLYAAKSALDEGQLTDCQRLVEGYWPRRLVEHFPAATLAAKPKTPSTPPAPTESQPKSFGTRIRGIVPKILR